jgi:hypothetical protein
VELHEGTSATTFGPHPLPVEVEERHPESGLPMLEQGGKWRVLGCLPPEPTLGSSVASWRSDRVLLPDQLRNCNYHADWPVVNTDDQGATESCVGHAVETVFSYAWLQAGQAYKLFSPTFLYGMINGGVDRGSRLGDAINALKLFGLCEARYVPEGMIFRHQFPQIAFANAKRHKPSDCLLIRSYDQLCTALVLGLPCATGLFVGKNIGQLEDDGCCPLPDTVTGGHAVAPVGLKYSAKRKEWLVLIHNSWGTSWGMPDETGQGGFAYLRRAHFASCFFDTWAVGGVQSDPDDLSDDLPAAN